MSIIFPVVCAVFKKLMKLDVTAEELKERRSEPPTSKVITSAEDWQEVNYGEQALRRAESPIYQGGMSSEIVFEELVSTAETTDKPLGTLHIVTGKPNRQKRR